MPIENLIGKTFNNLTVINLAPMPLHLKSRKAHWNCLCLCGNTKIVAGACLKNGLTQSCGCLRKTPFKDRNINYAYARIDTKEYKLFTNAKHRAKKYNLPFTITLKDIIIPKYCPVLGIPIYTVVGEHCSNSPTLDRFIPEQGYVPGNINVISHRANTIKSNATIQEVELLLNWMKAQ